MLVLFRAGEVRVLQSWLGQSPPEALVLHLFTDEVYREATFRGYQPVILSAGGWIITRGVPSTAVYPKVKFVADSDQPKQIVQGFYYTQDGEKVGAEWFSDGPYSVMSMGDTVEVSPVLTCGTLPG